MAAIWKKGDWWFISYYDAWRHERQEKAGATRKQADELYHKRMVERLTVRQSGGEKPEPIRPVTFRAFSEQYLEYSRTNKKYLMYKSECHSMRRLVPVFGKLYLDAVTIERVEEYKAARLETGVAGATVNRELACLKTVLNLAVEWGKLKESPIAKLKLFKEPDRRVRFLWGDAFPRLLKCAISYIVPLILVALYTGMRKGELAALRRDNVDLERGIIRVEETVSIDGVRSTPKSGRAREIDVAPELREVLLGIERQGETLFGHLGDPRHSLDMVLRYAHAAPGSRKRPASPLASQIKAMLTDPHSEAD